MPTEIVISYASEDVGSAGRLYDRFAEHFGDEAIFMDKGRLQGGANFPAVIAEAIRECSVVVAVVTPENWSKDFGREDDWVRRELREALAAGKHVVPVRMHGAPPPARAGLPPDLAALADVHARAIDDEDFADDVLRVIDDLAGYVEPPLPPAAFPELPEQGRVERRDVWLARIPPRQAGEVAQRALRDGGVGLDGVDEQGRTLLKGGSQLRYRVAGSAFVDVDVVPTKGFLRIGGQGSISAVELLLVENLRGGTIMGLADRYAARLDAIVAAVKGATGVSRSPS